MVRHTRQSQRARPTTEGDSTAVPKKRKREGTNGNADANKVSLDQAPPRRGRPKLKSLSNNNKQLTYDIRPEDHRGQHVTKVKPTNGQMSPHQSVDIFDEILHAKRSAARVDKLDICRSWSLPSRSIVQYLSQSRLGNKCSTGLKQCIRQPVWDLVSELELYRLASPFSRRCTALDWHPTLPHLLGAGCKGGDILLWNTTRVDTSDPLIQGVGPGGSIQAMKFSRSDQHKLYTASIDGTVTLHDFQRLANPSVLTDTRDCHVRWYCSLDTNPKRHLLVTGDNTGMVTLMSMDGKEQWTQKLHKSKVSHAEFSQREDWLLCTASLDHTVKMWDVRMIQNKNSALQTLHHDKGVNSAYFSLTDGTRLLTTDQHHEIRVYHAPDWRLDRTIAHPHRFFQHLTVCTHTHTHWRLDRTIAHPHRFFQHLTPIKAHWHPLQDLVVVGRYPDEKFPGYQAGERRTVDILDSDSGEMIGQLWDSAAKGIVSLCKFNRWGDCLATSMGVNLLLWSRKEEVEVKQAAILASLKQQGFHPGRHGNGNDRHGNSNSRQGNHRRGNGDTKPKSRRKKDTDTLTAKTSKKK